jgi:DNA-binding response OmpR family regulator
LDDQEFLMPSPKNRSRPLVFVVDDEPDILRLLELCLKTHPLRVEAFETGLALLERLAKKPRPKLFVLDVMMPGLSGYDVSRMIREKNEFRSVPIAFLTAKTSERDYLEGMQAGGNYYLEKPFDVEKLPGKVIEIIKAQGKV